MKRRILQRAANSAHSRKINIHSRELCLFFCVISRGSQLSTPPPRRRWRHQARRALQGIPLDLVAADGCCCCCLLLCSSLLVFVRSIRQWSERCERKNKEICTIIPKKCFYTSEAEKITVLNFHLGGRTERLPDWSEWSLQRDDGGGEGWIERDIFSSFHIIFRLFRFDSCQQTYLCLGDN